MALANITTKIVNSDDYNERKILASDVNQIKQAIQTGTLDIKPSNIHMEGNVITADGGQNFIRRSGNKFQYYDAGTWKEITESTNTATFTAGEDISIRDVVYLNTSDGKIYKASSTNYDWIGVAKEAILTNAIGEVYLNNSVIGGFSGLTPGAWYGIGSTAGSIIINKKEVGIAISATQLIIIKNNTIDLNKLYKLQGEKAINDVSATNSGVLAGSSQVLIDKFLDSNGQNNTVDTGATTMIYDSINKEYYSTNIITPNPISNYNFSDTSIWNYTETSANFSFTVAGNKGYIAYGGGSNTYSGTYGQISQSIDFTDIDNIKFNLYASGATGAFRAWVFIGNEQNKFQYTIASTTTSVTLDCSNITGTLPIVIRYYCVSTTSAGFQLEISPLICYTRNYSMSNIVTINTSIDDSKNKLFITPLLSSTAHYNLKPETTITNGDFETGSGASPTGWTYSENEIGATTWSGSINTTTPIFGTQDYKITMVKSGNGGDGTAYAQILQNISIPTHAKYIKLNYRAPNISLIGVLYYKVRILLGSNLVAESESLEASTAGGYFGTLSAEIDSYAGTTQDLKIQVMVTHTNSGPSGTVYVYLDNIQLFTSQPANSNNLAINVSLDGGSNYTDDILINTWNSITTTNTGNMIIKLNDTPASDYAASGIKGWRVLLE